jgi:small-conductance mechanosensitive channel
MSNVTAANSAAPHVHDPRPDVELRAELTTLWADISAWVASHWAQLLIAIFFGLAIYALLHAVRRFAVKLCDRPTLVNGWGVILGRVAGKTGNLFIVLTAARLVVGYSEAPPPVAYTIGFLFIVVAVFQAAIWTRELILGVVEHRTTGTDHAVLGSAIGLIRVLVSIAVFAIALIVVLDNLGVNVTGLVAGLGVGGIAIGLAAQGIFGDLFAALAIIFDRPFRVGDAVTYDQSSGTVEAIGLKSTRIRGINGELRVVSNKQLLDKEIQNNTERDRRRVLFAIGVVYQTPPEKCARIPAMLREIVETLGLHFVRAGFTGFGASSLDFVVEFDHPGADYEAFFDARHSVGLAILQRFNAEGIDFAYPTQTTFTAAPDGTLVMPYAVARP